MKQRIFCTLLCVALLLVGLTACNAGKVGQESSGPVSIPDNVIEIGSGSNRFRFDVVDKDGVTTSYLVHTSESSVGQALVGVGLLEGTFTSFGVLVRSVDGIPVDFTADQAFWGFYVDGVFADENNRVDQITIADDLSVIYSFRWTRS
jgi:hypothetical protein